MLDRDTLLQSEKRELTGELRGLPGVTLLSSGVRGTSVFSLRGASSGLGQFMLDGIPMYSTATGFYNLTALLADALERIEVVRGASAPRYGSHALGGVVRLFTRDSLKSGAFLHLEGGSFGTLSETASASWAGKRGRMTTTLSRDDVFAGPSIADPANSNTEDDDFHSSQGVLRAAAAPFEALELNSSLVYTRAKTDTDVPGLLPSGQIGLVDDETALSQEETWLAQGTASLALTPRWDSALQFGFTRNHTFGQAMGFPFGFTNRLLLANWSNVHTVYECCSSDATTTQPIDRAVTLTWGGEARQEEGENLFDLPAQPLQGSRSVLAGLAELQAYSGPWNGFIGMRTDHYSDFSTHVTSYLGGSWQVTPAIRLRASGGNGYRVPSFQELFFIPAFGNPTLKPEHGWIGDVGLDWQPAEATRLSLTGFYSRIEDLIQLTLAPTLSLLVGVNVPNARIQGVEVEGMHDFGKGLSIGADYTYMDGVDLDTDRMLPFHPKHQGRLYGQWQIAPLPLTLWGEVIYRGKDFDDLANAFEEDDAVYLNAVASYRLSPHFLLYLRGQNLTDDRTPQIFSFGTPGAAVYAGVRLDL